MSQVRWAKALSQIEKNMEDNKVEYQIADEAKLSIEANDARDDDSVKAIIEEVCFAFGGGDVVTIFDIVKEDQES
jgi:hypothetical protein